MNDPRDDRDMPTRPPKTDPLSAESATIPPSPSPEQPHFVTVSFAPADSFRTEPISSPWAQGKVNIPGFEILGELGRGGMGVVYKARQTRLDRLVALKMILLGGHAGPADLARFRIEAEAIARLQHPNIVQIHEIGEHDGLPYFSLEFCAQGGLDRKLAGTPLPPNEAAALVEKLARAMHDAHEKGVIHRDLKPANILLTEDGTPKITDFGLAKKVGEEGRTATGAVIGTPSYMAPEQAGGKIKDVGPLCDIYALGTILYECLTGRPPFKAASPLDTILQVVNDEPVSVTQLNNKVPKDLETICLKCLAKEPAKRYQTAVALAEDLRRFQAGEPIQARPVGTLERAAKWVRRNPVLAAVSAAALVALVTGALVSLAFGIDASRSAAELALKEQETTKALETSETIRREMEATDRKRRAFTRQSALLALEKGIKLWDEGDATLASLWLTRSLQMAEKEDADLERVVRCYLAHVPFFVHPLKAILPHDKQVWRIAFSPDGQRVVTTSWDNTARLWDAGNGRALGSAMRHEDKVNSAVFSPDGERLVTASEDGTARLRDGKTGQSLDIVLKHDGPVTAVAYSPDGTRIMTADLGHVWLWDATNGKLLKTPNARQNTRNRIETILFYPGGELAAVQSFDFAYVADGRTGELVRKLQSDPKYPIEIEIRGCLCMALSPDGKRLAAGFRLRDQRVLQLWDARTGALIGKAQPHPASIRAVTFSPDGKRLATGCEDGQIRLWDGETGETRPAAHGRGMSHQADVECVTFSPDGKTLLSGSWDGSGRLWDVGLQRPLGGRMHQGLVSRGEFNKSGSVMATASSAGSGRLWIPAPCRLPVTRLPRLDILALFARMFKQPTAQPGRESIRIGSDGRFAAVAKKAGFMVDVLRLPARDHALHQLTFQAMVVDLAFAPGGDKLLTASIDGHCLFWDAATGKQTGQITLPKGYARTVAFAPNGNALLVCSSESTARLWDPETCQPLGPELAIRGDAPPDAVFNEQGSHFVIQDEDGFGVYQTPTPVAGEVERVVMWVQVLTGLELDAEGRMRILTTDQWHERRRRLQHMGGPVLSSERWLP
jgi:WD40 repeat protein